MSQIADTALFTDPALLAYWKLADVNDSVGTFTLTNNASTTFTAGKYGNAATVNGTTQYLNTTNVILTGSGNKTICGWGKLSAQPAANTIMTPFDWGNATHRLILRYSDVSGVKKLQVVDGAATNINVSQTLTNDTWYHIALTHTSARALELFLNGTSIGTGTTAVATNSAVGVGVGAQQFEAVGFWNGQVDDMGIFNKILSGAEITTLATDPPGTGGIYSGAVGLLF